MGKGVSYKLYMHQLPADILPLILVDTVNILTVHCHAHSDTFLKAAELTLIPGDLVDDTTTIVLAGVGGVQVLLDSTPKEALDRMGDRRVIPTWYLCINRTLNCCICGNWLFA